MGYAGFSGIGNGNILVLALGAALILFGGYAFTGFLTGSPGGETGGITTFSDTGSEICTEDGKPLIRLFSTTVCSHCAWVRDTFDSVAAEYVQDGNIVARHWELDTGDDTLTPEVESSVPGAERSVFDSFSGDYVPAYSMGCKYTRVGNGHESSGDLAAEEDEFRAVIESLIR